MFCISHLFCHAVSWLRHEVVLSPWWEVCCRQEPVHSWHSLKQNQVIYTLSNTCLSCHQHLYTSGICWDKNRSFTHPVIPTNYAINICTFLAFAENKTGSLQISVYYAICIYILWHLLKQKEVFYTPNHIYLLWNQHLYAPSLLYTKPHLLTMTLVFVNSWHLLKQNRSLTHQVTPI